MRLFFCILLGKCVLINICYLFIYRQGGSNNITPRQEHQQKGQPEDGISMVGTCLADIESISCRRCCPLGSTASVLFWAAEQSQGNLSAAEDRPGDHLLCQTDLMQSEMTLRKTNLFTVYHTSHKGLKQNVLMSEVNSSSAVKDDLSGHRALSQ